MPKAVHGITTNTVKRFLVDSGAIFINYGVTGERVLGATQGGNSFVIEQEVKEIELDGAKGRVKGARRVISVSARITANILEMTSENLALMLAGSTVGTFTEAPATAATHDTIKRSRDITDADYITNVAIVGKISGTTQNFVGIISNALADGNFEISTEHKEEAVLEVQFSAHFDPSAVDALEPWEIRTPKGI